MKKRYVLIPTLLIVVFISLRSTPRRPKWLEKILSDITIMIEKVEEGLEDLALQTAKIATKAFKKRIKKKQFAISKNPYRETGAAVRRGGAMSVQEEAFLSSRRVVTRRALEQFIGFQLPVDVPAMDVYLSFSGGGNRSAIYSWSFLATLEDIGLLGTATHLSTLSGSAWSVWPWLVSQNSLEQHKEVLFSAIQNGPKLRSPSDVKGIVDVVLRDITYDRDINFATFYGTAIGSIFFHGLGEYNDSQMVWMDMMQRQLDNASTPYPILTFLSVPDGRRWTVTPHEFGCPGLGFFVPEWAAGRIFKGGRSVGTTPYADRVSLARWVGDSSLAPGASFKEVFDHMFSSMKIGPVKKILKNLMTQSPLERIRFIYSKRFNFMYGMPGLPAYDTKKGITYSNQKELKFTELGVITGNPVTCLLQRMALNNRPSILIICDASTTVGVSDLSKIKDYADGHNPDGEKLPFPDLPQDTASLGVQSISSLSDENMLVVYMPRVKNSDDVEQKKNDPRFAGLIQKIGYSIDDRLKKAYHTYNLKYNRQQMEELAALAEFNVLANEENLRRVIQEYVLGHLEKTHPDYVRKIRVA